MSITFDEPLSDYIIISRINYYGTICYTHQLEACSPPFAQIVVVTYHDSDSTKSWK